MLHRYVLADLHLGQPNIIKYRTQFSSSIEHDNYIIGSINAVVNPKDTLILAGDVALGPQAYVMLEKILCRNLILVPGNHDGERCPIRTEYFKHVTGAWPLRMCNTIRAVVTHIPIHLKCLDRWTHNVHGHLHNGQIDDSRYLCVSCEQTDYKPVNTGWIVERLMQEL